MYKYLLPFGETTIGILLNVLMYCILIFLVIYLPIYFSMKEKTVNNNPQTTEPAKEIITPRDTINDDKKIILLYVFIVVSGILCLFFSIMSILNLMVLYNKTVSKNLLIMPMTSITFSIYLLIAVVCAIIFIILILLLTNNL